MLNITVTSIEDKSYRHLFANEDTAMTVVHIEVEGHTYGLSRHEDEFHYYVDSHFGPNGFPYFCHGEGDRSVAKQYVTGPVEGAIVKAMLARAIDQAIDEALS